jgi:UDP-N-acetylmuramoylalanine--D-glutamate ligase
MLDLSGRIAVLGLGRSGEAVVRWALDRPGSTADDVVVFAEHDTPGLQAAAVAVRASGVRVELGVGEVPDEGFALVVASPGIAPSRPLLVSARRLGVPVISELELAYQVATSPFIAVTGTNGKTTVTALVAHLLCAGGRPAEVAGNIGTAALGVASEAGPETVIAVECSSFQLALTLEFHPRVAVLLNITPDHIDWHGSMETYVRDKARVFENLGPGDIAVVDVDDPGSAPWASAVADRGVRVIRVALQASSGARIEQGFLVVNVGEGDVELVPAEELLIRGAHNASNALAAASVALALGVAPSAVRSGLRSFLPIEHRLQPVDVVAGVEYVNDSKATNPDAVFKALNAFDGRPLIVLLGGRNKGNDFVPLAEACRDSCRLSVLYGEARPDLEAAFAEAEVPYAVASTMSEALEIAAEAAVPGDVVLLSPACASYDEFTGFEDRGRHFTAAVQRLASARR